ncbi:MAG: bifunctional 2-polyprenyl-6-hydroxyphenol methylase/3-demethylubiquinol 3-O-methyltransferase UbiG, partial [Thioalkalivibrionaceae bacterium]
VDAAEIGKFDDAAAQWWDPSGPLRTLHDINPLRVDWIDEQAAVTGKRVLDVGCGAGILAEALAIRGADVTGIDAGHRLIDIARAHADEQGLRIDYRVTTAEALADDVARGRCERFEVVTCMEMLEHVPDPASVIAALAQLVAPGGTVLLSTISRTPKAFVHAIIAAEYILRLVPTGTHEYGRFIKPSELARELRAHRLSASAVKGLAYNPITRRYSLNDDVEVNYLVAARAPR